MADLDLDEALSRLARSAGESAHPAPAARVRRLGARRHRNRVAAVAVVAVTALAVPAGVTLAALDDGRDQGTVAGPSPTPTSAPTSAPVESLTEADLLAVADLPDPAEEPFGWKVAATTTGAGVGADVLEALPCSMAAGPITGSREPRALRVFASDGDAITITEVVQRYPDESAARAALGGIADRLDGCAAGTPAWTVAQRPDLEERGAVVAYYLMRETEDSGALSHAVLVRRVDSTLVVLDNAGPEGVTSFDLLLPLMDEASRKAG